METFFFHTKRKKNRRYFKRESFMMYTVSIVVFKLNTCNEPKQDQFAYLSLILSHGHGIVIDRVDLVSYDPAKQCIGNVLLYYCFSAEM